MRLLDDLGVLLPGRGAPNGSASHLGWDEAASSRDSDEVRPVLVPGGAHPARGPDGYRRTVRQAEGLPVLERGVRHRDAGHRVPGGEPVARREPRSTGCCRPAGPWGRAWGRDLRAWELQGPVRRRWLRPRPEPVLLGWRAELQALPVWPEQRALPVWPESAWPEQRALPVPELPARPDGVPVWGRDGVRPVLQRLASQGCWPRDLPLRDRWVLPAHRRSRTGKIRAVDEPPGPRLSTMRT